MFYNNEFYSAIMNEDLGCIADVSKKSGSNFLIGIQEDAPGRDFLKGLAPLHLAASYREVKRMQSLLLAGADPEMRDQFGQTSLHLVITSWPSLLTTCSKPDSKFLTAVNREHRKAEACLQLLCEHGVNINAEVEGQCKQTALHLSAQHTALPAVHILARYGADVNAMDRNGMTPLHMAAGMLHKEIIAALIHHGADVNMGGKHTGNTPLHLAVAAMAVKSTKTLEGNISCISELLRHGADANVESKVGITPLQEACIVGSEEVVDLLLEYGANINKLSQAGESCLFLFLNHRPNLKNCSLLVKLLSLTSPLTIYNLNGHLPSTLTSPCFFKQRDQLLKLIQQPRRLQNICKSNIYLKYVGGKKEELQRILPRKLYDFVFNDWENIHNSSFVSDDEQNSLNNISDVTLS